MKLPEEYWSCVERGPLATPSAARWQYIQRLREDMEHVVAQISTAQPGRILVWRGQSDADYGLSSSLFRKALGVNSMSELNEQCMYDLESEIILYARSAGLGRGMTNVQLLQALQHYGVPTRLIDVSKTPVPALLVRMQ